MVATVALKEETFELLRMLKEESKAGSFDEAINSLLSIAKKPRRSMFGKFKNLPEFKREEIDRFD